MLGNGNDFLPESKVRGIVRQAVSQQTGTPIMSINAEMQLSDEHIGPILEYVGSIMDRKIPRRAKPRHGWKVSTLVGYISDGQQSFPKRENTAQ